MTHATAQSGPEAPSPDDAPRAAAGWARAELAEDLAVLARFRDFTAMMAEALVAEVQARAQASPAPANDDDAAPAGPAAPAPAPMASVFPGDPGLTFSRLSRAVRMTCNLRARLLDDIERLEDLQRRRAEGREASARAERKDRIARLLTRIIEDEAEADAAARLDAEGAEGADDGADHDAPETEIAEGGEGEAAEGREREGEIDVERLFAEAGERLKDRERYGDVLDSPVSAFIEAICRDLGLTPDWRRFAGEAWAREEIASGQVGAPLLNPSPPPFTGEGDRLSRWRGRKGRAAPLPSRRESAASPSPPAGKETADVGPPPPVAPSPPSPPPEPPPEPPARILTPREQRELEDDIAYAHALPGELPPRRTRPVLSPPVASR